MDVWSTCARCGAQHGESLAHYRHHFVTCESQHEWREYLNQRSRHLRWIVSGAAFHTVALLLWGLLAIGQVLL